MLCTSEKAQYFREAYDLHLRVERKSKQEATKE
jgi:hypothetical protein